MKWAVIILTVLTVLIWAAAGLRISTATPDTPPLVNLREYLGGSGSSSEAEPAPKEPGRGQEAMKAMSGGHLKEMEQTSEISTSNPQGGAEYNANKAVERASSIEEGRQEDLDDAKKKIGKIGK